MNNDNDVKIDVKEEEIDVKELEELEKEPLPKEKTPVKKQKPTKKNTKTAKNVVAKLQLAEADEIWNEIKDLQMSLFGLKPTKVSDQVERMSSFSNNVLRLKLKTSSCIASLDVSINCYLESYSVEPKRYNPQKYNIEQMNNVTRDVLITRYKEEKSN